MGLENTSIRLNDEFDDRCAPARVSGFPQAEGDAWFGSAPRTSIRNEARRILKACRLPHSVLLLLLLFGLAGCRSVPTAQSFQDMETEALAPLPEVRELPRHSPDESPSGIAIEDLLADGLTADEAVRIALSNNRRIQEQYERLDLAAANRLAARLLKNPEADGSIKFSTRDSPGEVLEVGAEIDALHLLLLPKRSRIGRAEYEAVKLDVIRAVQSLAYDTRVGYYRLLAAEQRLAMQQSIRQAAEAANDMAGRLREAGNIRLLDKLNRQALYQQALLGVSAAELGVIEAREDLNVLMGLSGSPAKWRTSGSLPGPPADDSTTESIEASAIENSLQLAITRERIRAAADRLGIARAESAIPAMHLGVHGEREPDGMWFVGPMISFELPLFNYGQADRPAARAGLRRLQQEYAALAIEIGAAARKAAGRVTISAQRVRQYSESVVPLGEQIRHRTQLQYNAMQLGVFALLQAKQMEIAARRAYISELLDYWVARTEFEQIRGGLLVQAGPMTPGEVSSPMGFGGNGGH
jgi:cobalt-zinc-cadmium efflux system outer membrane protein